MKFFFVFLLMAPLFISCNNKNNTPDVSNIKIELDTRHFEQDLFKMDTTYFAGNLDKLIASYPSFGENFLATILNSDPKWSPDSTADYVHGFITAYKPVYDSAQIVFKDFSKYEKEIKQALRFVKYYFPGFKDRKKIITYIGPLDGYGDILSDDAFIIGLQHLQEQKQ